MILSSKNLDSKCSDVEGYALTKAMKYLPETSQCLYIGFPWSELFISMENNAKGLDLLNQELEIIMGQASKFSVVSTVSDCACIPKNIDYIKSLGVTHFFSTNVDGISHQRYSNAGFNLYPIPLLRHELSGYSSQDLPRYLVANSLNDLWYCVMAGVVPLCKEGQFFLPGDDDLWRQAAIFYRNEVELDEVIINLQNVDFCQSKYKALKQLNCLYGEEFYIYDIVSLFVSEVPNVFRDMDVICLMFLNLNDSSSATELSIAYTSLASKIIISESSLKLLFDSDSFVNIFKKFFCLLSESEKSLFLKMASGGKYDLLRRALYED